MKIKLLILICLITFFTRNETFAQNIESKKDTTFNYLVNKCFQLFEPHADLTYSFGSEELKNEAPDLKSGQPQLKDTAKFFEELKGDYKDWYTFYRIGNLYQRFNQGQNAMNYFTQAYNLIYTEIKKDTLKAAPFSDMGTLYLNLNNGENAFYFYKRAYALNEKDSAASMFLPMFYINNGDPLKAEELVRKRLNYDPQNPDMYIWLLTSKIYQRIGEIKKDDQTVYNKSIDELFDLKDISVAASKYKNDIRFLLLEQLVRQLAIYAKYSVISDSFKNIKLSPVDEKELKNIQKYLQKIIDKNQFKNNYIVYKSLGFNFLLEKNRDKAMELFRKAMSLWPKDKISKDFYILFTTEYFIKTDTIAALKVIEEKIKNDAEILTPNAVNYLLKGKVLLQKEDYTRAVEAFNEAIKIQQIPDAYLTMSIPLIKEKNLSEANNYINKAYELDKEYYLTYALFGIITIMNNQKDEARGAFEKAIQLRPDDKVIQEIYNAFFPK